MGKAMRTAKSTDVRVMLDVFDYEGNKMCSIFDSSINAAGQAYDIVWTRQRTGWKEISFHLPYVVRKMDYTDDDGGFELSLDEQLKDLYATGNQAVLSALSLSNGDLVRITGEGTEKNVDWNYRWDFIKNEYLLRLKYGNVTDWYIIHEPKKIKNGRGITNEVSCSHISSILKTKNIYMTFESGSTSGVTADEINGVGNIRYLLEQALINTGWTLSDSGDVDSLFESDGVTEKIRSFSSNGKEGAYKLVTDICSLFGAYPEFDGDSHEVVIWAEKHAQDQIELMLGRDLDGLEVDYNSEDIITRLYVEGDYGQDSYVGIDDVNPTGLTYILNFDYYREVGLFTETHEQAYNTYMTDITTINAAIRAKFAELSEERAVLDDPTTGLWGTFAYVMYVLDNGQIVNTLTGSTVKRKIQSSDLTVNENDKLRIFKSDGTEREVTVGDNFAFAQDDAYALKCITPTVGQIGMRETALASAQAILAEAQTKLDEIIATGFPMDQDESLDTAVQTNIRKKVKKYQATIAEQTDKIDEIINGKEATDDEEAVPGLKELMLAALEQRIVVAGVEAEYSELITRQNNIEADFILAMGNLLKDGYWANENYAIGQEQALYDDAVEKIKILSRPKVTYKLSFASLLGTIGYTEDQLKLNTAARVYDPDLQVNDTLFVSVITRYLDDPSKDTVEVTNESISLSGVSLDAILSRMTALSNLLNAKKTMYERAGAITNSGTLRTDALEGKINLLTTQISSALSNWYTDERGNLVFESSTGESAMMITGEGWMIADGRKANGEWDWRTAASGTGIVADEITTGFLSADRIEARSITANKLASDVGQSLDLSSNTSVRLTVQDYIDDVKSENLDLYVTYNHPTVQLYDPNPGGGYAPDWTTDNLVLTPSVTIHGESTDQNDVTSVERIPVALNDPQLAISWTRGNATLTQYETVSNGVLTVSGNLDDITNQGSLTYTCTAVYTIIGDGETLATAKKRVVAKQNVTFSLVENPMNMRSAEISGEQIFHYDSDGAPTPSSIALTADIKNVTITGWQYRNANAQWTAYPNATTASTLTVLPSDDVFVDDILRIRLLTSSQDVFDTYQITKIRDGQTAPQVWLTNDSYVYTADKDGKIPQTTITTDLVCYVGGVHQELIAGDVNVGTLPTGMTVTKSATNDGDVRLTIAVADDATFGSADPVSGSVSVALTYPVARTVYFKYGKVISGEVGVGIQSIVSYYILSQSADTPPPGVGASSVLGAFELAMSALGRQDAPPSDYYVTTDEFPYLWTYDVITYTDGTTTTTQKHVIGSKGSPAAIVSDEEPDDPYVGMLWLDTSHTDTDIDVLKRCVGYFEYEEPDEDGNEGEWLWEEAIVSADSIKYVYQTLNNHSSDLNTLRDRIEATVTHEQMDENSSRLEQTILTQTANSLNLAVASTTRALNDLETNVSELTTNVNTYFNFSGSGLEIGTNSGSAQDSFKLKLANNRLSFLQDSQEVAYMNDHALYIKQARVTDTLSIGETSNGWFDWITLSGGLALKYRSA